MSFLHEFYRHEMVGYRATLSYSMCIYIYIYNHISYIIYLYLYLYTLYTYVYMYHRFLLMKSHEITIFTDPHLYLDAEDPPIRPESQSRIISAA